MTHIAAPAQAMGAALEAPTEHPGRWLGGLVGAAIPALVALVATAAGSDPTPTIDAVLAFDGVAAVSVAGIPIGFLVGRALLPQARSGGLRHALGAGVAAGLAAPPLGALGMLAAAGLAVSISGRSEPGVALQYLVLAPLAIVFGYAAVVVTLPVGIAWGLLVRAIPAAWLTRARMPSPIDRLGARHAIAALAMALVLVEVVRLLASPGT